jgi:adenosylmethionine-8-amino-7-oxononanoate aminotransferase
MERLRTQAFFPRDFRRRYPEASRASGIYIWDTRGRRYIDASGGAVVMSIGHGDSSVSRAVSEQMKLVSFVHSSQFLSRPALQLARSLVAFAGAAFRGGRAWFCSGGSEAVESALKLARTFHIESGRSSRRIVISRLQSYHGATLACLSAGGHPARRAPYEAMLEGDGSTWRKIPSAYCYRCPWGLRPDSCDVPCADALETAILEAGPENVSAFIAEPVSGAALGAAVPSPKYWPRIRRICDRYRVLLVADEVMTGFGRVGTNLGLQLWNVHADVVALGKGLASGYLPMAAVLARNHVWEPIASGSGRFEHGFTFSAHPVSCAAAGAVLRRIRAGRLVSRSRNHAGRMRQLLLQLQSETRIVGDVRGGGLLWGLELVRDRGTKDPFPRTKDAAGLVARMALAEGLLVYPGTRFIDGTLGDHVMLAPPLTVTAGEIGEIIGRLGRAIRRAERSL